MRKLSAILAISAMTCTAAAAQQNPDYEPITVQEYANQLLKELGPDALVMAGEVFATTADGETPLYSAVGGAVLPFSTTPAPTTPCRFPPLDDSWSGSTWYVWCKSTSTSFPGFEAKRDTYKSIGNRPPVYYYSSFFDCQNPDDKAAMTAKVRRLLCV